MGRKLRSGPPEGPAAGEDGGRRARTGRLTEEEISALCAYFAEPPLFQAAAAALDRNRVVVLGGVSGLSKRTSAIRLLLNAGAAPLEVVSPTLSLEDLSKHDFEEGHGYLVEDWQLAPRADTERLQLAGTPGSRLRREGLPRHHGGDRPGRAVCRSIRLAASVGGAGARRLHGRH